MVCTPFENPSLGWQTVGITYLQYTVVYILGISPMWRSTMFEEGMVHAYLCKIIIINFRGAISALMSILFDNMLSPVEFDIQYLFCEFQIS